MSGRQDFPEGIPLAEPRSIASEEQRSDSISDMFAVLRKLLTYYPNRKTHNRHLLIDYGLFI